MIAQPIGKWVNFLVIALLFAIAYQIPNKLGGQEGPVMHGNVPAMIPKRTLMTMRLLKARHIAIFVSFSLLLAQFFHSSVLDNASSHGLSDGMSVSYHLGHVAQDSDGHDGGIDGVHAAFHSSSEVTASFDVHTVLAWCGKVSRTVAVVTRLIDRSLSPPVPPPLA